MKRREKDFDGEQYEDSLWIEEDTEEQPTTAFPYEDNEGEEHQMPETDEVPDLDRMIGLEVVLPKDDVDMQAGQVIGCAVGDGMPIGHYNKDPMLDSRVYEVMFLDETINQYSSNIIAEAIWSDIGGDGHRYQLLDEVLDYKKGPSALSKAKGWVYGKNGQKKPIKTTKGYKLLVRWTDGQQSWIPLKDLKESYPIQVAEFAKRKGIADESAFRWWVHHVFKKKKQIISAVKSRVAKKTHKFGV